MRKPLFFRGELLSKLKRQIKKAQLTKKNYKILSIFIVVIVVGLLVDLITTEPTPYVYASGKVENFSQSLQSPLFEKTAIFNGSVSEEKPSLKDIVDAENESNTSASNVLKQKLYEIVGDAPIREMVPFISERDERVAAFLVGIAKKESSFGSRSPLKDGQTCYNYWGYKGSGERGTGMGYACFASAEEAIRVVGDRIEVLVDRDRNTPARMVNTWKCGTSCAGDPGAPGWISTVKFYFDKIVG